MKATRHPEPAETSFEGAALSAHCMSVTVIIPTFNHARFVGEAIKSALAQTRQPDEIIVVDDGSTDDPAAAVARFPIVRLIRQENRGLSAARNTGLWTCKTSHVVFLDADDLLLPTALESGLACIESHPDCAFVYGGHRRVSEVGLPLEPDIFFPIDGDPQLAFARRNPVGPPATGLHRRECLLAVNGFDEALRCCEDHDLYLRLAGRYSIVSHPAIVAEYRKHDQAISNDYVEMLKGLLLVFDLDEARVTSDAHRAALLEGRTSYRRLYVSRMLHASAVRWRAGHNICFLIRDLIRAARWSPVLTMRTVLSELGRRASRVLRLKQDGKS